LRGKRQSDSHLLLERIKTFLSQSIQFITNGMTRSGLPPMRCL
jgi:hypothetical protein